MDSSGRLQVLERQLREGWRWLRFDPVLEPAFREQHRIWALPFRLTLIGVAALLIAITPLLDLWLLHPPEGFMRPAHFSQIVLMLPALLLAAACSAIPRLRAAADVASLVAVSVVSGGLLYQRHLGAQYEVWVPTELITVTLAGAYVMGGLRFWRMTPLAILLLIAIAVSEAASYGNNATTQYIIFGVTVQLLIAGFAGYLQEHFARGAWLRSGLLEILVTQDALTGLLNFRAFQQRCRERFARAAASRAPMLVALLDLDYFKQYNDAYGHAEGNECLQRIAAYLSTELSGPDDLLARMGGEEFVIAIGGIERGAAERRLETLRAGIAALGIPHQGSALPAQVVTGSIGALWSLPREAADADTALHEADRCLYVAKAAGRDRVIFSAGQPPAAARS